MNQPKENGRQRHNASFFKSVQGINSAFPSSGSIIPLPPEEYSFIEMFCDEPECDCRRAFFTVISLPAKKWRR